MRDYNDYIEDSSGQAWNIIKDDNDDESGVWTT
jgi:hypothetical protein